MGKLTSSGDQNTGASPISKISSHNCCEESYEENFVTEYFFYRRNLDRGYPKPIAKGFDGIPDNIDAAFVWSGNGKIYFFKVSS